MALLRLVCFPSITCPSTKHMCHLTPLSNLQNYHCQSDYSVTELSFCEHRSSFNPLCLSISQTPCVRTRRNDNFVLKFSSSSQGQSLGSSSSNVSVENQSNEAETEEISRTRLLAQNIPWTSTPEDIRSLFEKHGKVLDVELSMYNKTRNRGLAFVEMGSPEEALVALKNLELSDYEGRTLKLNYARPKKKKTPPPVQPRPVTFNLFIANLSYEARAKDLREFFDSGSGSVVSAEVIFHDNPRRSSGYGFVSFKSKQEADAALTEFQGKMFMGRPLTVARSKQFVRQPVEKTASSEETDRELSVSGEEADSTD